MILLRLVGAIFDVLFLPLRLIRRALAAPRGAFVTLTIDGPVSDFVAKKRFWQMRAPRATSLHAVSKLVDAMVADPRVRGIIVTIRDFRGGLATAGSLRLQLARARAAGKEVVVHLPMGGGSKEVLVATAASRLLLGPAAQLSPLGFLHASRYLRRALERAGVKPEVFACGEYKSAGESLVRDTMSDPQREQVTRLLDGFHAALVSAIVEGRGVSRERAEAIIDQAPYFGRAAVAAGLADDVAYEDEVLERLGSGRQNGKNAKDVKHAKAKLVDGAAYLAAKTTPLVRPLVRGAFVAVIPVHGAIAHAPGPFGSFATDERVTRLARLARLDRRVRGVILHIDSPGGSALGSDRMHHEIARLAREKPVIACMANVAASGGYYVAAPAHRIVCEKTTVTGSIGVIGARLTVAPLLERLGVTTETIRRGARAGLLSGSLPVNDDERAAVERELEATYRAFVGVVASGRKMPEAEVERLARGRVYTGEDALAVGLVDVLGGFDVALEELRRMLPSRDRRLEPRVLRVPRHPLPPPDPKAEVAKRAAEMVAAFLPESERILFSLAANGDRVATLFTGSVT